MVSSFHSEYSRAEKHGGARRIRGDETNDIELSVILPVFNEEESLHPLHEQLHDVLEALGRSYEILYIDDGSTDASFATLKELARGDPRTSVVRFRRNFGQTAAIQAGIERSHGDILVLLDADLQNDPADIPALLAKLDEGYDVVSGWRKERKDKFWSRRLPSRVANWLISRVTGVALNDYGCTLKAYRREVLAHVKLYGEMHRFIPAIASWSGAEVVELPVRHHPRSFGHSKYGISRAFRVFLDLATVKFLGSFSTKPVYAFGLPGIILWLLGMISTLTVVIQRVTPPYTRAPTNPLFLMAFFFFTLGTLFIMMGLLGELVIRTYHESQGKPIYVVREMIVGRLERPADLRAAELGRLHDIQAAEPQR